MIENMVGSFTQPVSRRLNSSARGSDALVRSGRRTLVLTARVRGSSSVVPTWLFPLAGALFVSGGAGCVRAGLAE